MDINLGTQEDLLEGVLDNWYTPQFGSTLRKSIELISLYSNVDITEEIFDLIEDPDIEDTIKLSENIVDFIREKLKSIIKSLGLFVKTSELSKINEVLLSHYGFISCIDKEPYYRIIETDLDCTEKYCLILSNFSLQSQADFMTYLECTDPSVLDDYARQEDSYIHTETKVDQKCVQQFKQFCYFAGKLHIGYSLLDAGYPIGVDPDKGMSYLTISEDPKQAALDIVSFFLISNEYSNVLEAYQRRSESIIPSAKMIKRIELEIMSILTRFNQYKEVNRGS